MCNLSQGIDLEHFLFPQAFTKPCFDILEKVDPHGNGRAGKRKEENGNEKKGQGLVTRLPIRNGVVTIATPLCCFYLGRHYSRIHNVHDHGGRILELL